MKMRSFTKKGPGRRHLSGRVRPSTASMPEFGVDKDGKPRASLPAKYMHSHAKAMAALRQALNSSMGVIDRALGEMGYGRV